MVVKQTHLHIVISRLIKLGLALSPAIAIADSQQDWACQPAQGENWQCQAQTITKGTGTSQNQKSKWDWVPKEKLVDKSVCKTGCDGAYVAPKPDWPDANKDPETADVNAYADKTNMDGDKVTFTGNVSISQGYRRIQANTVIIDRSNDELLASGGIEVREPDLLVRANSVFMNNKTNLGEFESSEFLQHNSGMRGKADKIKRQDKSIIVLENGSITQCTPDNELWFLDASDITLDTDKGWGSAKHARLKIEGIPVFYTPYITFPIDDRRKSGFLFPTFSSNGDESHQFSTPYYLNLAPNYDATIEPRFISDRGLLTEAVTRHLSGFGNITLSGAYLAEDDLYTGLNTFGSNNGSPTPSQQGNTGDFLKQDRWLGNIDHKGQVLGINTFIDYTKVSDNDYFKDLNTNSVNARRQTHLNQQASLNYNLDSWQTNIIAQEFQTIDFDVDQQYKLMPRATIEYRGVSDVFTPEWIFLSEYTEFQHNQSIKKAKVGQNAFETGQRLYTEAGISYPMQWAAGFIKPTVKVRSLNYDMDEVFLSQNVNDPDPFTYNTVVPSGTLDMGLIFERDLKIGNSGFTQTLEPRLFYFYSDFEDQSFQPLFDTSALTFSYSQLFRDTRFSGHDRIDDANQTSAGLTTRFIDNSDGREVFSASVGQIFYLKDRVVNVNPTIPATNTLSNSFIASELQYQPTDKLLFSNTLLWDSRQDYLQEGGINMQYQYDNSSLVNVGYRFRRGGVTNLLGGDPRDLDQVDLSLALPISDQWKIYSRFQYDIGEDRSIEDMFGVGYEDCCWKLRFIYQRAIEDEFVQQITDNRGLPITDVNNQPINRLVADREHVFVVQFQLKGLGGIGNKAAALLEESILGYLDDNE